MDGPRYVYVICIITLRLEKNDQVFTDSHPIPINQWKLSHKIGFYLSLDFWGVHQEVRVAVIKQGAQKKFKEVERNTQKKAKDRVKKKMGEGGMIDVVKRF